MQPLTSPRARHSVGWNLGNEGYRACPTDLVVRSTQISGLHCTFAVQKFLWPQVLAPAEPRRPGAPIVGSLAGGTQWHQLCRAILVNIFSGFVCFQRRFMDDVFLVEMMLASLKFDPLAWHKGALGWSLPLTARSGDGGVLGVLREQGLLMCVWLAVAVAVGGGTGGVDSVRNGVLLVLPRFLGETVEVPQVQFSWWLTSLRSCVAVWKSSRFSDRVHQRFVEQIIETSAIGGFAGAGHRGR